MAFTNKNLTLVFLALAIMFFAHWAPQALSSRPLDLDDELLSMKERFDQWVSHHGRVYNDDFEKSKRFKIFHENVKRIEDFNKNAKKKNHLYTMGVNSLTDLAEEEFRARYLGHKLEASMMDNSKATSFKYENLTDVPSSMDWRDNDAVTEVKDQGKCGCCWAFSTVAAVEGVNKIATGKLISLSKQQLIDCNSGGKGCYGADPFAAFSWIQEMQGLTTESEYPYQYQKEECMVTSQNVATINGYQPIPKGDEDALLTAVSQQPVSVTINADYFQNYNANSGIFDGPCGSTLNHVVTFIGYGTDEATGVDYWLVKNSWGQLWGLDGYMKILRGKNTCSLAQHAAYPTM